MEDVKWLEIAINTSADQLDAVTAKLAANGMDSIVLEEEGEFRQFLEQNRQYWDYVDDELLEKMKGVARVKFYVTDDEDGHAQLARYTQGLDCEYSQTVLGETDWAYSWQKYYKPLAIGARLYVVPQWEKDQAVPQGRVPLYLNPGLTFGTGSHASTQLCLGWRSTRRPAALCWIWAAAAESCPLPLWCWGPAMRPLWTSTPKRWAWPMRTRS